VGNSMKLIKVLHGKLFKENSSQYIFGGSIKKKMNSEFRNLEE
jgi:hypothetical protein